MWMEDDLPVEMQGYWREEYGGDERPVVPVVVGGVRTRGTYTKYPYYSFVKQPTGANFLLVSDEKFRAELIPISQSPRQFKLVAAPGSKPPGGAVVVDFDPKHRSGGRRSFVVSGAADGGPLANGRYEVAKRRPEPKGMSQSFGSVFAKKLEQFEAVRVGYDITGMDLRDLQTTGDAVYLFDLPAFSSHRYSAPGDHVVPYGWRLARDNHKDQSIRSRVISSSRELNDAVTETLGYDVGADLLGVKIGSSGSESGTTEDGRLYANELATSIHTSMYTRFAYVLDKVNVDLSRPFYRAVSEVQKSRDFTRFFKTVGTHYPNSTTFGSKGTLFSTYTKQSLMQLHNEGVDVRSGVRFGISEQWDGLEAGGDLGVDRETARRHHASYTRIVGTDNVHYHCAGYCSHGEPSAEQLVPVLFDLRPISELLAPPFFSDREIIVELRQQVEAALRSYAYYSGDLDRPTAKLVWYTYKSSRVHISPEDGTYWEGWNGPRSATNVPGVYAEKSFSPTHMGQPILVDGKPAPPHVMRDAQPGDRVVLDPTVRYKTTLGIRHGRMTTALQLPTALEIDEDSVGEYTGWENFAPANPKRPHATRDRIERYLPSDLRGVHNPAAPGTLVFNPEIDIEPATAAAILGLAEGMSHSEGE